MSRFLVRGAALLGCVLAVSVCGEQGKFTTSGGGGGGGGGKSGVVIQRPSKDTLAPIAVGDSVFVQVHVSDGRGIKGLHLTGTALRGSVSLGTDTTVARFTDRTVVLPASKDTVITRYLRAVSTDSTSEPVTVAVIATSTAGDSTRDTSVVRIVNGPRVSVLQPAAGAVTAIGKSVTVQVRGAHPQGVKVLGWRATGVVTKNDSTIFSTVSGVLADTQTFTSSLAIPSGTAAGNVTIVPFATDSLGDPSGQTAGVIVSVQSVVGDVTPPLVQFSVPLRVEVGDSITVTATDPSGITKVGFIARDTAGTILHGDSLTFAGTATNVTQKFRLALDTITTFPRVIRVEAFGVDAATPPNRGVSSFNGTPKATAADQDTLTVVAGMTIALPQGGRFGDAIVNPNRNELYLTNTVLDQIEVFQLGPKTFAAPIRVGSMPLGIALWPRDTLGNNADTVIVANSGGTNLSIVDVKNGVERARHRLPNYIVETVRTQPTSAGGIQILTTDYDLSDRPQYLGAVCRHLAAGVCDSVVAVYSTAPTPAQPGPFTSRGYLAWENLTAPASATSGHFVYELADPGTDTLQIIAVRDTMPGQPLRYMELGAGIGRMVDLTTLAFQDSTFVRNSGDFNHVVVGEGGFDQGFARTLALDARSAVTKLIVGTGVCNLYNTATPPVVIGTLDCTAVIDAGVTPGIYVRDFLVNRASRVLSVATNFNGRTNLVRADSVYAFDFALRQTGLMQVGGTNPGMDFDPNNKFDASTRGSGGFGGVGNPNDRLVFAARPDANIDVFDTYWYARVATVPIRDTIIGPIRVANSGGTLVLVGVTSRGLVVVRLPNLVNPFPVRGQPAISQPARARPAVAPRPSSAGRRAGAQP